MHIHIHSYTQIHSLTKSFTYHNMNGPRDAVLTKISWTHKNTTWLPLDVECLRKNEKFKYGEDESGGEEGDPGKRG